MNKPAVSNEVETAESKPGGAADDGRTDDTPKLPEEQSRPKEIGGRDGPDPTRYGDWEKAGRCIDF